VTPYYEDDAVRLYLGDCRDVLPSIEAVDHVVTDPPYARDVYVRLSAPNTKTGSGTHGRMSIPAKGKPIHSIIDGSLAKMAAGDIGHIDEMLDELAAHIGRMTRRWALVFSDVETCSRWREALTATENECDCDGGDQGDGLCAIPHEPHCKSLMARRAMRYVRTGIWVKPDAMPQMSGDRPAVGFEPATICHAKGPMRWNGGGKQAVWTYNTAKGADRPDHPCPKPELLMAEIISQFTDAGETVLDPFAGSGTTLYAAKRLGRKAIGCEINERFAEVAAKRLSQGALELFGASDAVDPQATRQLSLTPRDLVSDDSEVA
jgi:hypothetical protein